MSAHFILYVADQAVSTAFYAEALGKQPRLDVPGMTEFELSEGAILGLMPVDGVAGLFEGAVHTGTRQHSRAELYLRVEDPAAAHDRAVQAGATGLSPIQLRDWGDQAAYSRDPDGHILAFASK
ncbi:MAG: VOC family protein [Proteobacteria bacterium]|nr:VOC family protein [Pseudomonadota bacterium]